MHADKVRQLCQQLRGWCAWLHCFTWTAAGAESAPALLSGRLDIMCGFMVGGKAQR